jgi:hypothetical protein
MPTVSKTDITRVLETLRSTKLELDGLIEEGEYIPSGELPEQIDESITILEVLLDA